MPKCASYIARQYIKLNLSETPETISDVLLIKTINFIFLNLKTPGLTSIEAKCLSYSFIYEIYGKNAYHTKFKQNLKSVLKV